MNKHASVVAETAHPTVTGFSAAEFAQMISLGAFRGMRVELVDGVIERMAPANSAHSFGNADVLLLIRDALLDSPVRLGIDLAVRISQDTLRGVDIAVVRTEPAEAEDADGLVRPDRLVLAVEIADTTLARDLGRKAQDYAEAGIPTYWVVDLPARVIHVFVEPLEGKYQTRTVVRFGEPLTVPGTDRTITLD